MGQEIVYCDGCRTRLSGQDLDRGGAFRIGHQTFCAPCAPKTPAPAPLRRPPSDRGAARVRPAPPKPAAARPLALWIALALAGGAIIVVVAIASNPGRNAPPKTEQPAP